MRTREIRTASRAGGFSEARFASAFLATLDVDALAFTSEDGVLTDWQTGSEWGDAGHAVAGGLSGAHLEPLPARPAFWFSIALTEPGVEVITGDGAVSALSAHPGP